MNNKGSTLVLLVIVITIVIVLGASILHISMMQYELKMFNTESKKNLYMSENGLNLAYVDAWKVVSDAVEDSLDKADEYLLLYPFNEIVAENIFKENYKLYITANLEDSVYSGSNPMVEITNGCTLLFIGDKLTANVKSKYNSANIEKTICVDLIILVPSYSDLINNESDLLNYISFDNWS